MYHQNLVNLLQTSRIVGMHSDFEPWIIFGSQDLPGPILRSEYFIYSVGPIPAIALKRQRVKLLNLVIL